MYQLVDTSAINHYIIIYNHNMYTYIYIYHHPKGVALHYCRYISASRHLLTGESLQSWAAGVMVQQCRWLVVTGFGDGNLWAWSSMESYSVDGRNPLSSAIGWQCVTSCHFIVFWDGHSPKGHVAASLLGFRRIAKGRKPQESCAMTHSEWLNNHVPSSTMCCGSPKRVWGWNQWIQQ